MTTSLAQKGQVVIPKSVREELGLSPGDDFEVYIQDHEIVFRPVTVKRNQGLMDILLNPPCTLEIPEREKEYTEPIDLDA